MLEDNPLVTVYIPTYNRVDLLKRAVNSVLNQTYKNLEIIIVDDNSMDSTHDYLKELVNQDFRVKYFIKEKNSGACVSRNIAIENAIGEYITGLDDDDYFLPTRIEVFMKNKEYLNNNIFLFTGLLLEKKNKIRKKNNLNVSKVTSRHLFYSNFVGNQIFCKKDDMLNFGGFDEKLSAWQDLDCWLKMLTESKSTGKKIDDYTYIVDDNDHLRITNNKKDKISNVFDLLIEKYNINAFDKKIFSVNLLGYGFKVSLLNIFIGYLSDYLTLWFWIRCVQNLKLIVLKRLVFK